MLRCRCGHRDADRCPRDAAKQEIKHTATMKECMKPRLAQFTISSGQFYKSLVTMASSQGEPWWLRLGCGRMGAGCVWPFGTLTFLHLVAV